jgi:hypothetical protein
MQTESRDWAEVYVHQCAPHVSFSVYSHTVDTCELFVCHAYLPVSPPLERGVCLCQSHLFPVGPWHQVGRGGYRWTLLSSSLCGSNCPLPSLAEGAGPGCGLCAQRNPHAANRPPQSSAGATAGKGRPFHNQPWPVQSLLWLHGKFWKFCKTKLSRVSPLTSFQTGSDTRSFSHSAGCWACPCSLWVIWTSQATLPRLTWSLGDATQ